MRLIAFIKKYKKHLIVLLFITVSLLIIRFIASIDFNTLKVYLKEAPGAFAGVFLMSSFTYVCGAVAWSLCMGKEGEKTNIGELFMFKQVGEMLTLFNPTGVIAGDGLKSVYLSKIGIPTKEGLTSILLSRILVALSGVFLIVLSIVYLTIGRADSMNYALIIILSVAVLLGAGIGLVVLMLSPKLYFAKTVDRLRNKTHWSFLTEEIVKHCYDINLVLHQYSRRHKLKFCTAFFLCVMQWIFGAGEFYIILHTFGFDIHVFDAVAIEMGVIFFKFLGSVIPGQLGVEEYGNKVMLDSVGIVSNEVWLAASLMRRGRQLVWLIITGLFVLIISKRTSIKLINK